MCEFTYSQRGHSLCGWALSITSVGAVQVEELLRKGLIVAYLIISGGFACRPASPMKKRYRQSQEDGYKAPKNLGVCIPNKFQTYITTMT